MFASLLTWMAQLAMFERIGGAEARAVAERVYADATADNLEEYLRVCVPLYTRRPVPPEVMARVTMRSEVAEHFTRGEEQTFDFRGSGCDPLPDAAARG
jgi:hypothetical protein